MARTNKAKQFALINGNYNSSLPTKLREILDSPTRQNLAKHLGVSTQQISNYCTGKTTPDADCLCKIAKYLGVSADYLFGIETDEVKATQRLLIKQAQSELLDKIIAFCTELKK